MRQAEAIGRNHATQHAVAGLLLQQALPTFTAVLEGRQAGSSAPADASCGNMTASRITSLLDVLGLTLEAPQLAPAVREMSLAGRNGAECVGLAAGIVRALPLSQPPGAAPSTLGELHSAAARLLIIMCEPLLPREGEAESSSGAADGTSSSAGCKDAGSPANSATSSDSQRCAALEVAGLVPHMAAVLRLLAANSGCSQSCLATICTSYAAALLLPCCGPGDFRSHEELGTWAASAEEGLRLLPLLSRLAVVSEVLQGAAASLSKQLLALWLVGGRLAVDLMLSAGAEPTRCQQNSCGSCTAQDAICCNGLQQTAIARSSAAAALQLTGLQCRSLPAICLQSLTSRISMTGAHLQT